MMIIFLTIKITALLFLLFLSAFFSSAETALFSLNPIQIYRIRKIHPDIADRISGMLSNPSRLLSTVLVGNIIVNVAASVTGLGIVMHFVPRYAELVSILVMTTLLLLFGEVTPKRLAMVRPELLAVHYAPWLAFFIKLLAPFCLILNWIAKLFENALTPYGRFLSEDEFRTLIALSEEEGVLSDDERMMLDGIIRLENIRASDVMTPRVDIIGLDMDDDIKGFHAVIRNTVYRYLVVYREHLDNIEGILDVRRYLLDPEKNFQNSVLPVSFLPESARLNKVLREFQETGRRIALVVDEYGGVAGLLTIGDILEKVIDVGDDDDPSGDQEIERIGETTWMLDGSVSLEEINSVLDVSLESGDADRISGWIMEQMRRLPRVGEKVPFPGGMVTVKEIRKKRIIRVVMELFDDEETA